MLDPLALDIPLAEASGQTAQPTLPTRKLLRPSPDHPDDYVLEVDYSGLSKFMECPRQSENYHVRSREADRDRAATDFGKLFHTLEEKRIRAGFTPETLVHQQETIAMHFLRHPPSATDYRTAAMMTQVRSGYTSQYILDGWTEKLLQIDGQPMVERPFKIPLCTVEVNKLLSYTPQTLIGEDSGVSGAPHALPFVRNIHVLYTGRIDAVLQEGPFVWVVDHKTSSRGGREFEEAFRLSLQTRGYCYVAQLLCGLEVTGLILNAAIIRPPTKTGKGVEFLRRNYFYSQDSLAEWLQDTQALATDFVSALVRGYFPQTSRSFKSPCAGCDYNENCTLPREQRAADLASDLYRDVTWSPIH